MTKDVIALVLAGGKMGNYGVLTQNRAKAALPFAANYRIIDFALTNLRQSRVERIGLIIQYLPASLIEHVGVGHPWDLDIYGRSLKIMPPFVGIDRIAWYKGTADALYQNLNFVYDLNPAHVIVLSAEHVYHLDFQPVIAAHRERNAQITMVTKDLPPEKCNTRFGYVTLGDGQRVIHYHEKPQDPPGNTVSVGIYVFETQVFLDLLSENAKGENHNLAKDILEPNAGKLRTYTYPMEGLWEYMEDVAEYYDTQLRMLQDNGFEMLRNWGVVTNLEYRGMGFAPAALCARNAEVSDIFAGVSCSIDGKVTNSILSPGVVIEQDAVVQNCILMHNCHVGRGAVLQSVVSDKDVRFEAKCRVGIDESGISIPSGLVSMNGPLTLTGKGACIGSQVSIPKGAQVRLGKQLQDQASADSEVRSLWEKPPLPGQGTGWQLGGVDSAPVR